MTKYMNINVDRVNINNRTLIYTCWERENPVFSNGMTLTLSISTTPAKAALMFRSS